MICRWHLNLSSINGQVKQKYHKNKERMMLYEKWGQGLPLTLIKEYRDVYNFMRFGIVGTESEEKRKEERAKSKGQGPDLAAGGD